MTLVLRWLVLLALLVTLSMSHRSSLVFDTTSTAGYVDALCGTTNTTCREAAEKCYYQVNRARTFLADLSSSSVTLLDRCNMMRDNFDTCADQANLNATWATITGSDRSCEGSFLRGRPYRPGFHRGRRTTPSFFGSLQRRWSSRSDSPRFYFDDDFHYSRQRRSRRIFGHSKRQNRPRGGRGQHRFDDSQSTTRVGTFISRIEESNPDAMQNYTRCMLRQEGLLSDDDTIARSQFETWATVAFATQPDVADVVKTAIEDCPEPDGVQLSEYMQCWGQACVESI